MVVAVVLIAAWVPAAAAVAAVRSAIVIDAESGTTLIAKRPDVRRYPASLTKMMTLYLLFEALDADRVTLATRFRVSRRAAGQPRSKLGIRAGSSLTVRQAILALIVLSANDVATVVGENLGREEWKFARTMTRKARALGMYNTRFRNASGLPNRRQVSTARDMARLARALMMDFPHYYHYFGARSFRFQGRLYRSHNRLLELYRGADGLKTGYIRASGFNLVGSAVRGGKRLIAVVLGGNTPRQRDREMVRLLDRGFARVRTLYAELPAPPPEKPIILANADWAVQVGAFNDMAGAFAALRASRVFVRRLVADSRPLVIPAAEGDGGLYRARFVGMPATTARRACRLLQRTGRSCEVVRHTAERDAVVMAD